MAVLVRDSRTCVECNREFVPKHHHETVCSGTCWLMRRRRQVRKSKARWGARNPEAKRADQKRRNDRPLETGGWVRSNSDAYLHYYHVPAGDYAFVALMRGLLAREMADGMATAARILRDGTPVGNTHEMPFAEILDELDYYQRRAVDKLSDLDRRRFTISARRLLSGNPG